MTRAEVVAALVAERFAPRPDTRDTDEAALQSERRRDLSDATADYVTTELVVLPGGTHYRQPRGTARRAS